MLTIRRLKQILVLANEGSFTRAARQLSMTQPALSRSIAVLEEECGLQLFERTANGVIPTKAGHALVAETAQLLGRVEMVEHNLRLQGSGDGGQVSCALGPLAADWLLTALLSRVVTRSPGLAISANVLETRAIADGVLDGSLDFGVCSAGTLAASDALEITSIAAAQMILVVRGGHPLVGLDRPVRRADLGPYPRATGQIPRQPLPAPPPRLEPTVQCNDFEILRRMTLATDTIWLTARETVLGEIARGDLVELAVEAELVLPLAELVLITLKGRSLGPAASRIIAMLLER